MLAWIITLVGFICAAATWLPYWLCRGPMEPVDAARIGRWVIAGGLIAIVAGVNGLATGRGVPVRLLAIADLLVPVLPILTGLFMQLPMGP